MENKTLPDFVSPQHNYYTLDYYFKTKYNSKVFKVALNGNFSCPNRDGKISKEGCIFCSDSGSGDFAGDKQDPLKKQFQIIKDIIHLKWKDALYIAYFQANTNTYAPLDKLKSLFEEAITLDKNIVAIDIATRPDCLSNDCLDYLEELNTRCKVIIELGLQTIHENTAKLINRGYDLKCFESSLKKLRDRNIEVIVHIINGLPHETKEMMLKTASYLSHQDIQGIKIHSLFILKGTKIASMYENNEFKLQTLEEYVETTSNQLALLRDDIVIHRISGDPPKSLHIAPDWCLKKFVVMNEIDKYMKKNNIIQGAHFYNLSTKK